MTVVRIGRSAGLAFAIEWATPTPSGSAATATRGWLRATIGRTVVWPGRAAGDDPASSWPWIELLEFLAQRWLALTGQAAGDPLGLMGYGDDLLARAEQRWHGERIGRASRDAQDSVLRTYLAAHDLAHGLQGADAPSLFVMRLGDDALVAGAGARLRLAWRDVLAALDQLGNTIANRVSGVDDERAAQAVERWGRRERVALDARVAMAVGWSHERVVALREAAGLADASDAVAKRTLGMADPASAPLAHAARMLPSSVSAEAAWSLLAHVADATNQHSQTRALDRWRRQLATAISVAAEIGHEAGYEAARAVRKLGKLGHAPVDVSALLAEIDAAVHDVEATNASAVDAVCAWRPGIRPVVVVNVLGPHAKGHRGRRATLAHELCHILFDLGVGLGYAEAKTKLAPRWHEARANAFAAELLVPREVAGAAFETIPPARTRVVLDELCREYDVSRPIVAWQALNSGIRIRSAGVRQSLGRHALPATRGVASTG